ncbi:hypothetical protein ACGF5O_26440 [Streptomyces sp. NPDC048291]|uniref:hypothetical protein n=1 Tax=Streptomyces sp. NPDC048291 TaxID=3365530 RepID=UPI0037135782
MTVESANGSGTEPVNAERVAREGLAALHRCTGSARAESACTGSARADVARAAGRIRRTAG